ncbi:monooxygenase [Blastococcus sp. TBT05-19]|uniref:FAD-dependent monooxygenase n=1 Tax=Blastococcus sp. TBT05-19 TaxID=2250581 RepID=UPI000DEAD8F1|nr:FAD-dependent monooxygenase [Blastococcus sp. TBT05-19]RBY94751.1 monooxygenase [Blastococcus sp. TBT05-19]
MSRRYEVIIVGAGPVGVALALELGMRGVSCAVVERRTELSRIPKGQNLTQRTMEHFRFWGLAEKLRAARTMPPGSPIGTVVAYGDLLGEFWHAPPGREQVANFFVERNERLPQYRTEEVLRGAMTEQDSVEAFAGWKATRVEQDDSGVRISIERDGEEQVLEAEYVVGCDGGRSVVAEQSGVQRSGSDFDQVVALAVFRSTELDAILERFPPRSTYRVVAPYLKGYWAFFGRVDAEGTWFFHAPIPEGTTAETADVEQMLHRAVGQEFAHQVDHLGFWDLRVQVAHEYRSGRAFIAGDAAHTHPPYGGFGLNNGLEDAVNLGWKLTAVLRGWGGDALLDSYSAERRAVFHDIGQNMIAAQIEREREFVEKYRPEDGRAEFEEAFAPIGGAGGEIAVHDYEPNYAGSAVVAGPPGAVSSAFGSHSFEAQAGHHLAPQVLTSGENVLDALGRGFSLLALDAPESSVRSFEVAADALGVPLTVLRDSFAEGRAAYASRLVLVRPDQHVAWAGDDAPEDVDALLRMVTGQR